MRGPALSFALVAAIGCRDEAPGPGGPGPSTTTSTPTTERDWCGADDLRWSQPVVEVDDLVAVPIDAVSLEAWVDLDATAATAEAEGHLVFRIGPDGGSPLLDLRQEPAWVELDGDVLDPAAFGVHTVTDEVDAEVRVLAVDLPPCSEHELRVGYPLAVPRAPEARGVAFGPEPDVARWDLWSSDLYAGRYLEAWFPSNFVYDRLALTMHVSLVSSVEHVLITNGTASAAPGTWDLAFPDTFTSLSPMVILLPATDVVVSTREEAFSDGTTRSVEVFRSVAVEETDPPLVDQTVDAVELGLAETGAWLHGDRVVVYAWAEPSRSMEYDGATSTKPNALTHELYHSWFGRGLRPALGRDGWIDEAWNVYVTGSPPFEVERLRKADVGPVALDNGDPFSRITPGESYDHGQAVFAHLAQVMGVDELRAAMAEFYALHAPDPVQTSDLETFLYCRDESFEVAEAFHRWVRGRSGEPELPRCP